jgi:hypothetical protein
VAGSPTCGVDGIETPQADPSHRAARRRVVAVRGNQHRALSGVLWVVRVVAVGPPERALVPETLARAYGGHVHVLDDGTVTEVLPVGNYRIENLTVEFQGDRHWSIVFRNLSKDLAYNIEIKADQVTTFDLGGLIDFGGNTGLVTISLVALVWLWTTVRSGRRQREIVSQ